MIRPELLAVLCCPQDRQPLTLASEQVLAQLDQRRLAGALANASGSLIMEPITDGLLRADGRVFYPIRNGIPILLLDEAITL
ncbi:MAG TPA: hypothetical protein VGO90_01435 [Chthoniobacteraceae bacterium]|nr:hypothetical protein [Chthoniobacteraceae bacterium]